MIEKYIDHTNIKKTAKREDVKRTVEEAKLYHFRGICVREKWTKFARYLLKNFPARLTTLIDPPCGFLSTEERIKKVKKAKENGTDEVDVVIKLDYLKQEKYEKVLEDLKKISKILPTKVIICDGYLTPDEIKIATEIVKDSGAFCVKTATEKDPLKDLKKRAENVKLMRKVAGKKILVKASVGIRTLSDTLLMIESGADIIGTSSGTEIKKEEERLFKNEC